MRSGAVTKQTFLAARLHVVRQRALDERRGGSITAAHVCGAVHKVCDQRASEPQNASPNDSVAPTFRALQFFRQMNMDILKNASFARSIPNSCKKDNKCIFLQRRNHVGPSQGPRFQTRAFSCFPSDCSGSSSGHP